MDQPRHLDDLARLAGGGPAAVSVGSAASPWSPAGVHQAVVTAWLVQRLLRRGGWSVHRHVHLLAAFAEVHTQRPVRRLLSIGAGSALPETYLAALHPELEVVLTDLDPQQVARTRRRADRMRLSNITTTPLDLLAPGPAWRDDPGYDLVVGIEVLEHIDDDATAAATIASLSRRYVYQLVPRATPAELADPVARRRAWRNHHHHRVGYMAADLTGLFPGADVAWVRPCYHQPAAGQLRAQLGEASRWSRLAHARHLVARAAHDIDDPDTNDPDTDVLGRDDPGTDDPGADGLELLARIDRTTS